MIGLADRKATAATTSVDSQQVGVLSSGFSGGGQFAPTTGGHVVAVVQETPQQIPSSSLRSAQDFIVPVPLQVDARFGQNAARVQAK